ncbi:hypothetical protein VPHK46_0033 [Vibrio phage K46]|nr:hypothetical protein SIPHO078v2_p0025 [Vibrio phage 14E30.1]
MKFESKIGKKVYLKGQIVEFKGGNYETEDKEETETLKTLKDVKSVSKK